MTHLWLGGIIHRMSTLAEIERAAAALPPKDKERLMLILGAQLRAERASSTEPRRFTREQIQSWIAQDQAALRQLRG